MPGPGSGLLFRATARTNLLPEQQTAILLAQLDSVLADIILNPDNHCDDFTRIPQMPSSKRPIDEAYVPDLLARIPAKHKIIEVPDNYRGVEFLHDWVTFQAKENPMSIAIEFVPEIPEEGDLYAELFTYSDLNRMANKIAYYLIEKIGVLPGDIVAVCFDKCAEASIVLVGILKAGAAFVALDFKAPADRKAFIVKDSGAKCLFTMEQFNEELAPIVEVPIFIASKGFERKLLGYPGRNPGVSDEGKEKGVLKGFNPQDPCYCLYTSGTTGTPKGCLITHENAVQAMMAFQGLFKGTWHEGSRFLQFAAFHFDVSVLEQFWSWSVGITLTSAPRDEIFKDLPSAIHKLKITHLDLTPSLAALLYPEDVPLLTKGVFITGGEALRQDVLEKWGKMGCLYNGYGPTEVTIGCTMLPKVPANGRPSNIGPAFPNVGSYVFTPNTNRPVLRGALGELCVSGALVGKGYLNRDDLTQEKFPYVSELGERIYRTGDYVRMLHNGDFDFLGRTDDQVKLRGQRLEIGEINEVLKNADEKVRNVATLVLKHPKQQKQQLVSFFVSQASFDNDSAPTVLNSDAEATSLIPALLTAAKRKLPVYMVPTHFIPLSKIPLSVNNKVDNKALTALYNATTLEILHGLSKSSEGRKEDWTETEKKMRSVFCKVTGVAEGEVSRDTTIFEMGLDSVSVVGLATGLRRAGWNLGVSTILQSEFITSVS